MNGWRYHNPVQVVFGAGSLESLPAALGARDALVVTFPEAREAGIEARLAKLLGRRLRSIVREVPPNPDVARLADLHACVWAEDADAVLVAVGGGSVIDTAKALQLLPPSGRFGDITQALREGEAPEISATRALIAVPTTAGSGSDVTPWATLWDLRGSRKLSLHTGATWPERSIVDPRLALSLPASVTRNSALDALSHALESIWNRNANPVSDALAVEAARGVIATLPVLMRRPDDLALRTAMARAALMAGLAFSNTKTALAHAISYEMTLAHGLPHGLACSFTLPMVWRLAAGVDPARDAVLARVFGEAEGDPPARLEALLHATGVATRFEDYGVEPARARAIIARAARNARAGNFIGEVAAARPAAEPALT